MIKSGAVNYKTLVIIYFFTSFQGFGFRLDQQCCGITAGAPEWSEVQDHGSYEKDETSFMTTNWSGSYMKRVSN